MLNHCLEYEKTKGWNNESNWFDFWLSIPVLYTNVKFQAMYFEARNILKVYVMSELGCLNLKAAHSPLENV